MSVQKLDFNRVRQSKRGFTTCLNDVIQNIPDAFVLGLYVYLSSLPPEWSVNRQQLMNHFKVGRDKIHKSLLWLKDNLLLTHHQERRKDGTLEESTIIIHEGWEFLEKLSTDQSAGLRVYRTPAEPASGKTAPINNIDNKKEIKRKREALSDDFIPDKTNIEIATKLGVDLKTEIDSFKNRWKGQKTQYEFGRWLKNAKEHADRNKNGKFKEKSQEVCSTVKEWKKGNPDFDRVNGITEH